MDFVRVNSGNIHEGDMYTEPLFFDDGKNMFLPEKRPVKLYHLKALERWSIPYVLTKGKLMDGAEVVDEEEDFIDDLEELETLDDVEEL